MKVVEIAAMVPAFGVAQIDFTSIEPVTHWTIGLCML